MAEWVSFTNEKGKTETLKVDEDPELHRLRQFLRLSPEYNNSPMPEPFRTHILKAILKIGKIENDKRNRN